MKKKILLCSPRKLSLYAEIRNLQTTWKIKNKIKKKVNIFGAPPLVDLEGIYFSSILVWGGVGYTQ